MIDVDVTIDGLSAAFEVVHKTVGDARKQTRMIHGAMGHAARKHFLPDAKRGADSADQSGALAESLKVRAMPVRKRRQRGIAAGMELVPVRYDKKAMAKYVHHYYTSRGEGVPPWVFIDGIRHGHLIEFGFSHRSGKKFSSRPFLYEAVKANFKAFEAEFSRGLWRRAENAIKREAAKRGTNR